VDVVPLVAPTSGTSRIERLRALRAPFIYYISMTGVTGAAFRGPAGGPARVAEVRQAASAPVAVGFGIKTPEDARQVGAYADGVVVGSAVVQRIAGAAPGRAAAEVATFVADLRRALNSAR
jgi:tryptophan synthase alpha chain